MIVVRIQGGLGNQLFQYAFGRALSRKHKEELKLDVSWFSRKIKPGVTARTLNLDDFAIPHLADMFINTSLFTRIWYRIRGRYISEPEALSYTPSITKTKNTTYYNGYWQHPGYAESVRDILSRDLSLHNVLLHDPHYQNFSQQIHLSPWSASIHVRRTDYAQFSNLNASCTPAYYEKAMKKIATRHPAVTFFVFSDDIEWSRTHLPKQYRYVFIPSHHTHPSIDLVLMSLCNDHIIANSTYSWWGAWIDKKKDGTTIGPRIWNGDHPDKSILLPTWQRI